MNLTGEERAFVLLFLINFLVALLYLAMGLLLAPVWRRRKSAKIGEEVVSDNYRAYLLRFVVMVLCPVVGPLFFLCAWVLYRLPLWAQPHLEDVVFSKERAKTRLRADEERERDIVPLEEALFLNKSKDLRLVMMNTVRGDVRSILGVIMLALNSEDSETAHYAASVLSAELDAFRTKVGKLQHEMAQEPQEETAAELELLSYMNHYLEQKVFFDVEQKKQANVMAAAAGSLFDKDASLLTPQHYESVCLRLIEAGEYEAAMPWCHRLAEQYPNCLEAYTCSLKLFFSTKNREAFFSVLDALKKSDVIVDQETLELIKVFS